jgi:hypothetical protein
MDLSADDHKTKFENFKTGKRTLFVVMKKESHIDSLTLFDIAFRKIEGGRVAILFWDCASDAERFILEGGGTHVNEVRELSIHSLIPIVEKIFGASGLQGFNYVLY